MFPQPASQQQAAAVMPSPKPVVMDNTCCNTAERRLNSAINLSRWLPPEIAGEYLDDLICLCPDLADRLITSIDKPLMTAYDSNAGREYLLSEFNRDADSYRSCWSNLYVPPIENGLLPSAGLRSLEIHTNKAFEAYKNLYFGGGISSVYFWDTETPLAGANFHKPNVKKASSRADSIDLLPDTFCVAVLMKKIMRNLSEEFDAEACWDSIHVVTVKPCNSTVTTKLQCGGDGSPLFGKQKHQNQHPQRAHYDVISTVLLWLHTNQTDSLAASSLYSNKPSSSSHLAQIPSVHLAGTLVKDAQFENSLEYGAKSHVANLGRLVEDMENRMRNSLDGIYFGKTREVLSRLRLMSSASLNVGLSVRQPLVLDEGSTAAHHQHHQHYQDNNIRSTNQFKEHIETYLSNRKSNFQI